MTDQIMVTGMVLSVMAMGEYDKRLVILTKERGKISAFVRRARRPGSALMAASQPFAFGTFTLMAGRDSYTVISAGITDYFEALRKDVEAMCYGCYFLEFADYYGRENDDCLMMLKLLYQSVRALCKRTIPLELVRRIFELKMLVVNGEYPQCFECVGCRRTDELTVFSVRHQGLLCTHCSSRGDMMVSPAAVYALQYVISSSIEKLYTFNVTPEVLSQLVRVIDSYLHQYVDRHFKSMETLTLMQLMADNDIGNNSKNS